MAAGESAVSGSLSSPLRGAFHLSLTVLVHYRLLKVLSLGGWSPQLPTRFHVPRGTQDPSQSGLPDSLLDSHHLWWGVPAPWGMGAGSCCWSYNPRRSRKSAWFGLLPFRSPLLRESRLISSRRATEMFQFTRCPPSLPMCSVGGL